MKAAQHFLSLADFGSKELKDILALSSKLKAAQKKGEAHHYLDGKTIAMIFEKPSNRTRISFETGIYHLGAKALHIRQNEIEMGKRESIPDVARVMARYVDAVMMRVLRHDSLLEFAEHSTIPVINGLSDICHPCQGISDMFTIQEVKGELEGLRLCYIGDGNNVCNSLIQAARILGLKMVVCCPKGYDPSPDSPENAFEVIRKPKQALVDADVVYTDVWTSMGQEAETAKRLRDFGGYTVTPELMKIAKPDAIFMHCLPAHRGEEVEHEVLESKQSVVFDQAENRLHVQKAILCLLLGSTPN